MHGASPTVPTTTDHAVLVHGDVEIDLDALQAADGTSSSHPPWAGVCAQRACDLGTIIRRNPDAGDDLHARTKRVAC